MRVMVAVKTTEGGRWTLPQIEALRRRCTEVVVLLPEGEGRLATEVTALADRDAGVRLVRSPFDFRFRPRFGVLAELAALRRLVVAAKVDCVLYHLYATALAIRLTTWGLRLRRVHMIAGPLFLESPVIASAERLLWRLDSHIICSSRYIFQRYRALGVPPQRMSVVPYGVDTTLFKPISAEERAAARHELDLPANGLIAVMVSYVYAPKRLAHRGLAIKGHEVLLQAWPDFHCSHPEATLLLVGSGFDAAGEKHRQDLMRQFGYEAGKDGVIWLDSMDDVRVAYRCADVSISPSLSDNHGAVREASAMGLPSIVSDAGALAEAVENGVSWVHRAGSPEDLQRCLGECARAWTLAGLKDRGDAARRFTVTHFEEQSSAEKVADQVCGGFDTGESSLSDRPPGTGSLPAGQPPVRVFSEARLHRAAGGAVHAADHSSGAAAWDVYVERLGAVELVARVGPADASGGVPVGRIEVRPLPFYSGPRQLVRRLPSVVAAALAATAGPSICLFRLPGTVGLLSGAWCRLRGRRYAVEVVGDPASVLRSGVLGAAGRHLAPAAAGLMRWVVAGAAAGRYVTESTLQRLYPLAPGALEHHYSNVRLSEEDFTASPRPIRPVRRLLAVGSHDQLYKGHDDLIRAVALLAGRGIHVDLGLVGDGRHHALLRNLARTTGVADRVTFHGRITDRAELRRLLDEADLFCTPSRTEGLPRALIEAMARGLPAMGTDVGGIRELLDRPFRAPPSDPAALAALIAAFVAGTVDSGEASRTVWERAQRFGPCQQAERIQGWLDDVQALARTSS